MKRGNTMRLGDIIGLYKKSEGLERGFETLSVFKAWDEVVGVEAATVTTSKFFKDGILYVTLSSSVFRSDLYFQLPAIKSRINQILGGNVVKFINLK